MGGPGVLVNAKAVKSFAKYVRACLTELQTSHEDVEIGRCFWKHMKTSCTSAYEASSIFRHTTLSQIDANFLSSAATVHPLKKPADMLNVHLLSLQKQRQHELSVLSDCYESQGGNVTTSLLGNFHTKSNTYGYDLNFATTYPESLANWKTPWQTNLALKSLSDKVLEDLNKQVWERGRTISYRGFNYGYSSLNFKNGVPHSMNYILDLQLTHRQIRGNKVSTKVRKHIHLTQYFVPLQIQQLPTVSVTRKRKVNFILPLFKKESEFDRFLVNFEEEFLTENVKLIVVSFTPNGENHEEKKKLRRVGFDYTLLTIEGEFSRGLALQKGSEALEPEDLMFFIDVDIRINSGVLNTIRLLVEQDKSVYFPIVFSNFGGTSKRGYWRQHGYGMVALFKSDFVGMDLNIHGWGKEDVALFNKFMTNTMLRLYRAPDKDLVHLHHKVHCDQALSADQLKMCESSLANNFRSDTDAALALEVLGFV